MRKLLLLTGFFALAFAADARAFGAGDKGTAGAQFLKVGPGARPAAMGEAFSGVADDVHAIYYNPAGLGNLKRVEVAGMHNTQIQGINYEFAAVAVPLLSWVDTKLDCNRYGVAGFAVYNLSVSGIQRRGLTETDSAGDTFGASDFAYAFSYAYAVPEMGFSFGATGKFIDLNLDDAHARGFAADLGALYSGEGFSFGAGARNGGNVQKLKNANDPLPLTLFSGVSYLYKEKLLVALDMNAPRDDNAKMAVGAEYRHPFNEKVTGFLRGGYNMRHADNGGVSGASMGVGLGYNNFNFDFAWVPYGDLGNTFRYSLHVKF